MSEGLPRDMRPPTEAELERQQREALGLYDSEKHRKEVISIKAMSEDDRKQAELENEHRHWELSKAFDGFAIETMKKVNASENPKNEFGRGVTQRCLGTIQKYLNEKQRLKLDREKFEWAKTVYSQQKLEDFTSDIARGIVVDIKVEGVEGGTGGASEATDTTTPELP
jgi:hypothetical protein